MCIIVFKNNSTSSIRHDYYEAVLATNQIELQQQIDIFN